MSSLAADSSSFAYSINDDGQTVGTAENGNIDPLTGYPEFVSVIWRQGMISTLGTLGGNQSAANAINDRGQVVGAALNAIPDPLASDFSWKYLFIPAATQVHAFLWTEAGGMRDLGTLGGPDSTAAFVNQRGQIAGQSYINATLNEATSLPTQDPFFWENGHMLDIGTLGGTLGQSAGMNNRGQVIGKSDVAGDQTFHAFLWDRQGGIKDLGTLEGYSLYSEAHWINDAGEVVGESDAVTESGVYSSHAFLWKNGHMVDIGTVAGDACGVALSINSRRQIVGFGSADCNQEDQCVLVGERQPHRRFEYAGCSRVHRCDLVIEAIFINDRGEIAARGKLANGDEHAIVLFPCDENHPDIEGCDYGLKE